MIASTKHWTKYAISALAVVALASCGGGSDDPAPDPAPGTPGTFTLGGSVSGLAGGWLVLSLNGTTPLALNANGAFSFPAALGTGSSYAITVALQPSSPTQLCTVSNGSGTVNGAVSNVQVNCVTQVAIGGTVAGLSGSGLQLSLNGGAPLPVGANGNFVFPTLAQGSSYNITVAQQPAGPAQICAVSNGSGVADGGNITNVRVDCVLATASISGVVAGLAGTGLQLSLNGGAVLPIGAAGAFSFAETLGLGTAYTVTVAQQPAGGVVQECTVVNGSGTVGGPVTNVQVNCPPPAPTALAVTASQKRLQFSWTASAAMDAYRLQRRVGTGAWTDDGPALAANATSLTREVAVHLMDWRDTRYRVAACNAGGCTGSSDVGVFSQMLAATVSLPAPIRPVQFGNSAAVSASPMYANALSPDGSTIAAPTGSDSVRIFVRGPSGWVEQAVLTGTDTVAGDSFGSAVALSADGNTLAVGASDRADGGTVYVFVRDAGFWTQESLLVGAATESADSFGNSLALSNDGRTLLVGAPGEDSGATGVNGAQGDNSAPGSGAAYVFVRGAGGVWSQQVYLKASNTQASSLFGRSLSMSGEGETVAVGAPAEDAVASNSGAVYVFTRQGGNWSQQAYLKASNVAGAAHFGFVTLSANGSTLAVGANRESTTALNSGAVYVFQRQGTTWSQEAFLKSSNAGGGDTFGHAVSLAADGNLLAVASPMEDSLAFGVNGTLNNEAATESGAVYLFERRAGGWVERSTVKSPNTQASQLFGYDVRLSADGSVLLIDAANAGRALFVY